MNFNSRHSKIRFGALSGKPLLRKKSNYKFWKKELWKRVNKLSLRSQEKGKLLDKPKRNLKDKQVKLIRKKEKRKNSKGIARKTKQNNKEKDAQF